MASFGVGEPHEKRQRAQAIVLIAIMLAVVVGMAALAIDGSRAYAARRDLQAAVDAAALAAGDKLQQTGNYTSAEQAATSIFGTNLRLYSAPGCAGYGSPGAATLTVTCTYSDGTILTQMVSNLGPQGSRFTLVGSRSLVLEFGKVLTNGASPTISASSSGGVNNLLFTPIVGVLAQAGCGGAGGNALTLSGAGTLNVSGDVVSSGGVSLSGAGMRVAGDIYARCQSTIPGSVTNACYPSGVSTPCTYPDVAGVTRSGFRFVDPNYPAPAVVGGSQSVPVGGGVLALSPGVYAGVPSFGNGYCWFLSGGVYDWQAGYVNSQDFVSNELKPPDEPSASDNTVRSSHQFWDTDGVRCSGGAEVDTVGGPRGIPTGDWSFVLTSTRTDTFNGLSYMRESAPSMCYVEHVSNSGQNIQIEVSNVPGATAYNIYAAPPGNGCDGPFGLVDTLPVSVTVSNTNTNPCPAFTGNGCTLGHESATLDANDLSVAPNALTPAGTPGAFAPNGEASPLAGGLPNQNPARLSGSAGDRANENNCESAGGVYVSCPGPVTPGAVVFYLPATACLTSTNNADTYIFSGYQYNWVSVYEPGRGSPPANTCANTLGADGNSAYIGLVYTPSASVGVPSPYSFESAAMGGLIANSISFSGAMPTLNYGSGYAPVPPASRLTG